MYAGVYTKPTLAQVAHVAVNAADNSHYRLKYEQISKCRLKEHNIIAIARNVSHRRFPNYRRNKRWSNLAFDEPPLPT